jgi:hypothetical protein
MALTAEQQAQVDIAIAIENGRVESSSAFETKRNKMQAVQLAQQIVVENRRYQNADNVTDITATEVVTLAENLMAYVNS